MGEALAQQQLPLTVAARVDARQIRLEDIRRPVEDDLKAFNGHFREAMRSDARLLNLIVRYLLRQKGKRIRPLLVLLAARACGPVSETSYRGAALVELLHTATLVHDDVVDESDRRRSAFSINALWKNKVGVLLGDYLLSRGLLLALDGRDYQLLHIVSDAVRRMSEGELMQIEKARRLDIDEETYLRIISDKTASLLAACTTCGAASATEDEALVSAMRAFGEKLGLAFQIRDDLFDYGVKDVGKPLGIDLQEKKMTLPLIVALRSADKAERRRILRIVRRKKKRPVDIEAVNAFVRDAGGISYARDRMLTYADQALAELDRIPAGEAREALADLVVFTVQRSH